MKTCKKLEFLTNFHWIFDFDLTFESVWSAFVSTNRRQRESKLWIPGADAIKKFTPSLGIPYLGV